MIGLVLVTHGELARHFVHAMQHVVGPQDAIETICIGPQDDMEKRREEIADAIAAVDTGAGAIVLTDLFGGTPSNLAISLLDAGRVEVIAGINLPMLIRLAGVRNSMAVTDAVVAARDAGRNYITIASEFLGNRRRPNMTQAARRAVTIVNQRGLHARASAKFVGAVAELPDTVRVRVVKDAHEAGGGSILGLMMLGAAKGDTVEIVVDGPDAPDILDRVCAIVEQGFGEE